MAWSRGMYRTVNGRTGEGVGESIVEWNGVGHGRVR